MKLYCNNNIARELSTWYTYKNCINFFSKGLAHSQGPKDVRMLYKTKRAMSWVVCLKCEVFFQVTFCKCIHTTNTQRKFQKHYSNKKITSRDDDDDDHDDHHKNCYTHCMEVSKQANFFEHQWAQSLSKHETIPYHDDHYSHPPQYTLQWINFSKCLEFTCPNILCCYTTLFSSLYFREPKKEQCA